MSVPQIQAREVSWATRSQSQEPRGGDASAHLIEMSLSAPGPRSPGRVPPRRKWFLQTRSQPPR